jgi:hypothetical protein
VVVRTESEPDVLSEPPELGTRPGLPGWLRPVGGVAAALRWP